MKTVTAGRFMAFGPCAEYPEGRIRRIAGAVAAKRRWLVGEATDAELAAAEAAAEAAVGAALAALAAARDAALAAARDAKAAEQGRQIETLRGMLRAAEGKEGRNDGRQF
jgi:uncharacterized protein YjbJ (UPF0337 family)